MPAVRIAHDKHHMILKSKLLADEAVMRAEEKLYVDDLNTQALSAPMQTEEVIIKDLQIVTSQICRYA
jgi:hypothetical protein